MGAVAAVWEQLGLMTQVGLVAQAATIGLLAAAVRKPSKTLAIAALVASVLGLFGLSLAGIGNAEYTICGTIDPPPWCSSARTDTSARCSSCAATTGDR